MCLENISSRCSRCLEIKLWLWLLCCQLNNIHIIKLLLSRHCHISCGNSCFISCNEILKLRNLLLLLIVSCLKLRLLHSIHLLEIIIITRITVQFLIIHMINNIYNTVKEWNIVRYQYKCVLIVLQISLKPLNMLLIKIVSRLIKKKDVRFFKKQLSKQYLSSLSA